MANWAVMLHDKIVKRFPVEDGAKVVIGRGKESDIAIDNTAISRQHIAIEHRGGVYIVSDMGSKNGSFVNGKKITEETFVAPTDVIEFGKFRLVMEASAHAAGEVASTVVPGMSGMDGETIFVSAKKPGGPAPEERKGFKPRDNKRRITVVSGEATPREVILEGKGSLKIGKDSGCDLVIPGWFVGKPQCYIIQRDKQFCIVPQKGWVGTYVNDVKVSEERILHPGDVIRIKQTTIRYD